MINFLLPRPYSHYHNPLLSLRVLAVSVYCPLGLSKSSDIVEFRLEEELTVMGGNKRQKFRALHKVCNLEVMVHSYMKGTLTDFEIK